MNRTRSDVTVDREKTRRQLSWLSPRATAVVLCLAVTAITADDTMLPLVAPVRTLQPSSSPSEEMMLLSPEANTPPADATLPGTRLPQYQLGHDSRKLPTEEERSDPRLRLILAHAGQPLLIEATITLDGQPFRMLREQRVQKAFEQAQHPRPQPDAESSAADSADDDNDTEPDPATGAASDGTDTDTATAADTAEEESTAADSEDEAGSENAEADDEPNDETDDSEAAGEEEVDEAVTPPTVPPFVPADDVTERLQRHIEATGRPPTLQEVRWILTNWVDGPELLMLNDGFQRFRAAQRPVFFVLDRNRDGIISQEEITRASDSIRECDLNRDEVVDYEEIGRVAADPRHRTNTDSGPGALLFPVPDANSAARTYRRMLEQYRHASDAAAPTVPRFDKDGNGRFDADELAAFHDAEPDLRIAIAFDSQDPDRSSLQLTSVSTDYAQAVTTARAEDSSLILTLNGSPLEISAVQSDTPDQISVGAIVDGYPLLSRIDPTPDGRLTIRDRRSLLERLNSLDENADGQITADEMRSTTRLCFGRGPVVDNVLASLRNARTGGPASPVTGPEWFVRMDRNRDGDVTRSEFPGNDEQFAALDEDGDELVSAAEAVAFESRSETSADQ